MLIKIFKIFTSLILLGILFFLVTKRDLIVSASKNLYSKKGASSSQINTVSLEASSTPLVSKEETPPLQKVAVKATTATTVVAKPGVYTKLEEGASDFDPGYRPITSPCKVTIAYKIGTLDSHFGISKDEFIQEINTASDLWGNAVGKKLFRYDEKGPLTINLIYDERQARTESVNNLALEINNAKDSAEAIRTIYEKEKVAYLASGNQLTKDAEAFQIKYKAYADKVATYNENGGAPKNEYDQMMRELIALKEEGATLESRRTELLTEEISINKKVARYNEFVIYINELIKRSNELGAKKFTEGRFSPSTNNIDIYQYNDTVKLRRVIAHELGHVLGINHNDAIQSIMYSVNSATTTTLSNEDLRDLAIVCSQ